MKKTILSLLIILPFLAPHMCVSMDKNTQSNIQKNTKSKDNTISEKDILLFHTSILEKDFSYFKCMLDKYSDNIELLINSNLEEGSTPLHLAVIIFDTKFIKELLQYPEINPNQFDQTGWAPLHIAAAKKNIDALVELAYHPKTDINIKTKQSDASCDKYKSLPTKKYQFKSMTPLFIAIEGIDPTVIRFLLRHGADLHTPTQEGITPQALLENLHQYLEENPEPEELESDQQRVIYKKLVQRINRIVKEIKLGKYKYIKRYSTQVYLRKHNPCKI